MLYWALWWSNNLRVIEDFSHHLAAHSAFTPHYYSLTYSIAGLLLEGQRPYNLQIAVVQYSGFATHLILIPFSV